MSEESDPLRLRDDPAAGAAGRALRGLGLADFADFDPATSIDSFESAKNELTQDASGSENDLPVEPATEVSTAHTVNGVAFSKVTKGILLALGVSIPLAVMLNRGTNEGDAHPPSSPESEITAQETPAVIAPPQPTTAPEDEPVLEVSDAPPPREAERREPVARRARSIAPNRLPPDLAKREIQATNEMRRALRTDPARTLRLAERGNVEFRGGMFGHERAAYAVLALIELGRIQEAKPRAKAFLAEHPKGPLSERVQRALAGN